MATVSIISDIRSERLNYVCEVIFSGLLGISHEIVSTDTERSQGIQIFYTSQDRRLKGEGHKLWIPRCILLGETTIRSLDVNVLQSDGLPILTFDENREQRKTGKDDLSCFDFDLFAMVFYLISRYEEYEERGQVQEERSQESGERREETTNDGISENRPSSQKKDKYGRYISSKSIAFKSGFLQLPLIDLWVARLAECINESYNQQFQITNQGRNEMTLDIDMPYAYRHKGWKAYAGVIKDIAKGQLINIKARATYTTKGVDPFDTYEWIKAECAKRSIKPHFFILNKYQKPDDENHIANSEQLYELVRELSQWSDIGIHPSLSAGANLKEVKKELNQLESGINKMITKSRQHFLMLTLHETYKTLIASGITDDYSMGYPDQMGFRASTARPFLWYDLASEKTTKLTIHPCITMDVTMRYYLKLPPAAAIEACNEMIAACRSVSGTFSVIWHNSSLSDAYGWGPWKEVFIHLLNNTTAQPYGDT